VFGGVIADAVEAVAVGQAEAGFVDGAVGIRLDTLGAQRIGQREVYPESVVRGQQPASGPDVGVQPVVRAVQFRHLFAAQANEYWLVSEKLEPGAPQVKLADAPLATRVPPAS